MIPINDKEVNTAAKNEMNESVNETAAPEQQAADTVESAGTGAKGSTEQEKAEGTEEAASGTGDDENGGSCGDCDTEDGSEEDPEEGAEADSTGKTGLKGAFLNRKQKKEEKKSEKELEKLKKELADKTNEMAVLNDKYLRICAEYDNFRKRSQKEKDSLYGDIRSNVVTGFLPVFDNLERALAAHTEDEAYAKGVEMIMNQFNKTLEKLGVEEIPALGQTFDPALHNAVMHVDDETKGENEIVEVFQKGFRIGDKIIRFSMVKVAN